MSKALSCVTPYPLAAPVVLSCAAGGGGGGLLLWQDWPPALALIVPYVPWVMALIGIAICLMYQRSQTMALMLSVLVAAAAWPALAEQAPWALGPALAWWALAYTINALWAERSSVLLDLAARLGLMASGAAAIALASKEGTADFFSTLAVQGALARLGVPVEALAALLATGLTLTLLLLRYGRPQQAGQWLGFVCMAWALPRGAQHPVELALMSAAALTSLCISLAHEGFHMAFRDELTGLPGRRALNEKLQRMGRITRWPWRTWIISRFSTIPMATTWATRCCAWSRRNCARVRRRPCLPLWRRGIHAGVPRQDRGGKHAAPGSRAARHRGLPDAPARQAGTAPDGPGGLAPPWRPERTQHAAVARDGQHRRGRARRRVARARSGHQGGRPGAVQGQGRRPQPGVFLRRAPRQRG